MRNTNVYMASRGELGHTECGGLAWRRDKGGNRKEWGHTGERRRGQQPASGE